MSAKKQHKAGDAPETTVALNPLTGVDLKDLRAAAARTAVQGARQPLIMTKHVADFTRKLLDVLTERSNYSPEPGDSRFRDDDWESRRYYRRLLQAYLALDESLEAWLEDLDLNEVDRLRANFVRRVVSDSIAPSNSVLSNPKAMRRLRETRGKSLRNGARNLIQDWRHNHGIPRQVSGDGFQVGKNLANTPGQVVFRNEVLELIQYENPRSSVYRRPVVMVSAMINKYYALDMTPDRSLVRHCLAQGIQVFVVSWANPQIENAHWGIEHYGRAVAEALTVVRDITRCDDVNLFALCSGGMAMSAMAAWLRARGDTSIHSMTIGVCMLEMAATDMELSAFASEELYDRVKRRSAKRGILHGHELATSMLWMRPGDLIWSQVINNYLLGEEPPEFDLLYWNNDWTNLPAALHADVIDMFATGSLLEPGRMKFGDDALDLQSVSCDKYFVAGRTDHITPWEACYRTASAFAGKRRFVLSDSGHIQTLLNSPAKTRARFFRNDAMPDSADEWLRSAETVNESWWLDWTAWIIDRAGPKRRRPARLGNRRYAPLCAAPGEYVHQPSELTA